MKPSIIWLHDEALRLSHPVFSAAPVSAKAIFIWDDAYLRQSNYSLKRLVFIYETLSALPIEILHGDTLTILGQISASSLYVPYSHNSFVQSIMHDLAKIKEVHFIKDEPFVKISHDTEFRRFFSYWNKAEKSAFVVNGGSDA